MPEISSQTISFDFFIESSQQGLYLTVPFEMPADVEKLTLVYAYPTHNDTLSQAGAGRFLSHTRINTIDLGLIAPDGRQVGASGSDKTEIFLSETQAVPGYQPQPLTPGTWQILAGAYRVADTGVTVTYTLTFQFKSLRLLMGDPHTHTIGSDGILTLNELAQHARAHGLDFLCITDHNQMVQSAALPHLPGLTLIPGVEWTHYHGHANFLGVDQPYDPPFFTNTSADVLSRFQSAREHGALIVINHPCDELCPFTFEMNTLPFDCLEVWNGPMRDSNLRAIGLWQQRLLNGQKLSAICGSDYHRDSLFQILGGPCLGVYAKSNGKSDILAAMLAGHSFITFQPNGPSLEMHSEDAIMGDSLPWSHTSQVEIRLEKLTRGDSVRLVTPMGSEELFIAPDNGQFSLEYPVRQTGFVRLEIWRTFLPGVQPLPALISNPIYFD